jgi:hypothetical protein
MEKIYIGETKIILDDLGEGRGSLIISNGYNAYDHYWGSMGGTLNEFILRIDTGYFAGKMLGHRDIYEFDAKASLRNVRAQLKEDLPWYEYMSAQKELREELRGLKYCSSQEEFVDVLSNLHDKLMCYDLDRYDEAEFLDIIRNGICSESWHLLGTKPSREYNFLVDLLPKLQKHIKKTEKELVH